MTVRAPSEEEFHFAIADDPLYRLQRRLRLVPREGRGLVRRALFFALLTWLPLAIWAGLQRRLLPGDIPEPLLGHFGVHVRCLIGLPLFILAEGLATRLGQMTFRYFVESGIV